LKPVRISKENPFFTIEDNMVMSSDRKRLICYFGSESRIVIKKEVEVIGKSAFNYCIRVGEVVFEEGSRLRLIEDYAFYQTGLKRIVIPASVEVVGEFCFGSCFYLHEFAFERESNLKEIKGDALFKSALGEIEIPAKCQILAPSSLTGLKSVTVSKENPFLVVEDSFLKSSDRKRLIRYMGSERRIVIKREVEGIGEECFHWLENLCEVVFEEGSKLRRLERKAFMETGLTRISIPGSVEAIGEECFFGCESLREVVYEGRVPEIGENAFHRCPL
jgi:hypothetical protein